MLSANSVKGQINQLVGCLVEIGLSSDQNLAFVRTISGRKSEVTFPNAEHVTISLKDRSYSEIYEHLLHQRAYVLRLPDGALVLMRYDFSGTVLERHSLSFLPAPHLTEFQNNPELYGEDVLYADVIARSLVPFPLRFDYDCRSSVHRPLVHPKSHLTLGQYENCRIPVSAPLTPYWFVSFVLRNFYNTAFTCYASELPAMSECFDECIANEERSVVFFQVPNQR